MAGHDLVLQPGAGGDVAHVVVIAELVTLLHLAVGVVEVVLHYVDVAAEVAFGEVVDIAPELGSEQVAHRLEIAGVGIVDVDSSLQGHDVAQTVVKVGIEHVGVEVGVAVLEDVSGASFVLRIHVGIEVAVVGVVEGVPVDLVVLNPIVGNHLLHLELLLVKLGIDSRGDGGSVVIGHVLIVVGTRVGGLIPVESRIGIVVGAEAYAGVERGSHLGFPDPVEEHGGVECLDDSGALLLAVEITPGGVVEVGAGEVVGLLGGGGVVGALCGGAPGGEVERMVLVEDLLHGEEITEGVIERSVDHALVRPASDHGSRESPAVLVDSRRILEHCAEHIVGVGVGDVSAETGGVFGGVGGEVARSAEVAVAIGGGGEAEFGGAVAESARCHSAHHRIVEHAPHGVVVVEAVDITSGPAVEITAQAEAGHREVIVGGLIVDVVVCALDGSDSLAHSLVVEDLLLFEEI